MDLSRKTLNELIGHLLLIQGQRFLVSSYDHRFVSLVAQDGYRWGGIWRASMYVSEAIPDAVYDGKCARLQRVEPPEQTEEEEPETTWADLVGVWVEMGGSRFLVVVDHRGYIGLVSDEDHLYQATSRRKKDPVDTDSVKALG
jgi:hypothetical protein